MILLKNLTRLTFKIEFAGKSFTILPSTFQHIKRIIWLFSGPDTFDPTIVWVPNFCSGFGTTPGWQYLFSGRSANEISDLEFFLIYTFFYNLKLE